LANNIPDKKNVNRKRILKELYFSKTLSCAELCLRIDKSFPILTKLLTELIDEGIIVEMGYATSTGGRRPLTYAINKDVMYLVSVAMDQFITRIAIMDMHNNYVFPVEKLELTLPKNPKALSLLTDKIDQVILSSGIPKNKIIGIGIGMPGLVDVHKGINYSFLHSSGKTITQHIFEKIEIPVFIDNDSSLIALTELRFGAARDKRNAMVVNIGWGVGLGIILNGELFRGSEGFAGEFSHIPLFLNGKLCSCGKIGCMETETSLHVIIENAKEGLRSGRLSKLHSLSNEHFEEAIETIIAAALEGDQFAVELFSQAGYNIGMGVAILIHLLNPEIIILSGRGSLAGEIWKAPIQQAVNEHCIPRVHHSTTIEVSTIGYNAELIGAAALVMENFEKGTMSKDYFPLYKKEVLIN
jgi:predicted NBD/HSP70 family sugar kinase